MQWSRVRISPFPQNFKKSLTGLERFDIICRLKPIEDKPMSQIKSTLNFVNLWPKEGRSEESSISIISNSKAEADKEVSNLCNAHIQIERNEEQDVTFQCYLKSVKTEEVYHAKIFDMSTASHQLSAAAILNFIIENGVRLVPTPLKWETSNGEPANWVTHDVYVGKRRYQGMTVQDAIHQHLYDAAPETEDE